MSLFLVSTYVAYMMNHLSVICEYMLKDDTNMVKSDGQADGEEIFEVKLLQMRHRKIARRKKYKTRKCDAKYHVSKLGDLK